MTKSFKKLHIITLSLILAVICGAFYCLTYYQKPTQTQITTRNIEVGKNAIDYEAYFEQFDSVSFVPDEKLSTLNLVQTVDEEFLSEINNNSSTTHYKGEICYDIEYDHENGKVYLNATLYLDDEGNCLFEKVEGVACWNENINDIDIVFEAEDDIIFLSDLNEDINNCGWFKKALKFVKKHAVAIVATVAVVAVVATVAVAAPAFVAAATAVISTGGGTAGLAGGIGAGLVAAGSAIASSTLVSTTVAVAAIAAGVAIAADVIDVTYEGVKYILEAYEKVKDKLKIGHYYLCVTTKDGGMLITPINLASITIAVNAYNTGLSIYTPNQLDANQVATLAGNGISAIHDFRHKPGYFNHYHRFDRQPKNAHVFYGCPVA